MKPETQKHLAATARAMKSAETYLQQQKKINEAFAALDTKITGAREQHKELLRKAGAVEAKRLLGELSDEEAQTLDISLTQTREQQDRLSAATDALKIQKQHLDAEAKEHLQSATVALSDLASAFHREIEEELQQTATLITSIVDRLTAFEDATGFGGFSDEYRHIEMPSLVDGRNLFRASVSHIADAPPFWRQNNEAVKIHERLSGFGHIYRRLCCLETQVQRAIEQAEREAEEKRRNVDAA